MTRRSLIAIAGLVFLGRRMSLAQEVRPGTAVKFPGTYLKLLRVAEQKLIQEGLKPDNYMISLFEEHDRLAVIFRSVDSPEGVKGSGGTYPAYSVEIRKADAKIVSANFER